MTGMISSEPAKIITEERQPQVEWILGRSYWSLAAYLSLKFQTTAPEVVQISWVVNKQNGVHFRRK